MATPVVPGATFRDDFPKGFLFGASTSAFQIEGAVNEGGRGPSIWDTYAREQDIRHSVALLFNDRKDFLDYANLCFTEFGDRVRYWITFCGPWSLAYTGYGTGTIAPGRVASSSTVDTFAARSLLPPDLTFCQPYRTRIHRDASGDPGTEPYLVARHQLLAHAAVVKLYRDNYQNTQKGKIGIILQQIWPVALTDTEEDRAAAQRCKDNMLGCMKDFIGSRLRPFTDEESLMVKGSYDFIALNYYTASYVRDAPEVADGPPSVVTDPRIAFERIDEIDDPSLTRWESLTDHWRVSYYQKHLSYLKRAITEDEVKVKGYFIWSLTDNFEWGASIYSRFGNAYIDYDKGYARHPKLSAEWFRVHLLKPSQR
ncbi:hypothetical protein RJ639_019646 [Escallonia herrerae]|uniref:Beta-glucosidase n=1 Tax=Escallonia herrerae TaxID=1293975 RepID=A0AA89AJN8_9ASTE|nr:hypothetical protein RJ639_019646 [Escallonia herrerae]